MGLILQLDGYTVALAEDGDDAMLMFDTVQPDLIVMDWRMPGLHGADLVRAIRGRDRTVPVVIVSGSPEAFRHEEPVDARFAKPIDAQRLRTEVAAQLALHSPAPPRQRRSAGATSPSRAARRSRR
jgi:two-component system phosphate regulon response regulator PhoB